MRIRLENISFLVFNHFNDMNKFIVIVFAVVCLKSIESAQKPKSINPVPYYEVGKNYVIKGEKETGKLETNDVLLYQNNKSLKEGKLSITVGKNSQKLYVNESMVLGQNPKKAPIVILNPHLKAENISSIRIEFKPDDEHITYTLTTSS